MFFDKYAEQALLGNVSVSAGTSLSNVDAFRGDVTLVPGDIADTQGRRHPPKSVIKQAVMSSQDDKLTMVTGAIEKLESIKDFLSVYAEDFASDIAILFYVGNISKEVILDIDGLKITLIPHDGGAVWTLMMDDLCLEKSDFKGQSAEDKVITMLEALNDYSPKYDSVTFEEASEFTREVKKEARGPV